MRSRNLWLLASVSAIAFGTAGLSTGALAQGAAALTGAVSSAEEGNMEGVLVSAKKDGSTITVTVATDEKGNFSFPADRLSPGKYDITIRAAGYSLSGTANATITAGQTAKTDLKLGKVKDLTTTLTNAEWLLSAPGGDEIKSNLLGCTSCHTYQRIFTSVHDAEEFKAIFKRMGTYSPGSTPPHPQPLLPGPRGERPAIAPERAQLTADWLASVNKSKTGKLEYALKTLPRPKGKATHVIITEYDLPRDTARPHDVIMDKDGIVWYGDFADQFLGYMDPKTGKATDIPLPVLKPEQPKGNLEISFDPDQKDVWLALMYQAGVARINRETKQVTMYPFPKDWQSNSTQASMVSPQHSNVDGKVWTNNQEYHDMYRLDVSTGQFENVGPSKGPDGKQISAYGMPTDYQNNVYQLEFGGTNIGLRDAKTGKTMVYRTPTPNSRPRRGRVDGANRLWFAEYQGDAIGMFDSKTAELKEYKLPTKWSNPYDVVPTKDASEVWTGSMSNDHVARLETKSGQFTEYLLPRPTNIRRVFVEENSPRPTLWVGSNHGASIVKVEPLD